MSGFDQTEEEGMLVWNRSAEGSPRRGDPRPMRRGWLRSRRRQTLQPMLEGFALERVYFGEVSERRPWIEKTRRRRAAVARLPFVFWLWAHGNSCGRAPELLAAFQSRTLFCRLKFLFQLLGLRAVVTVRWFFAAFGFPCFRTQLASRDRQIPVTEADRNRFIA